MTTLTDDELLAWLDRHATPIGDQLAARFRELIALQEWQPIETAPRDGRWLLLYGDGIGFMKCGFIGYWGTINTTDPFKDGEKETWRRTFGGDPTQPTYWRPLPPPPKDG